MAWVLDGPRSSNDSDPAAEIHPATTGIPTQRGAPGKFQWLGNPERIPEFTAFVRAELAVSGKKRTAERFAAVIAAQHLPDSIEKLAARTLGEALFAGEEVTPAIAADVLQGIVQDFKIDILIGVLSDVPRTADLAVPLDFLRTVCASLEWNLSDNETCAAALHSAKWVLESDGIDVDRFVAGLAGLKLRQSDHEHTIAYALELAVFYRPESLPALIQTLAKAHQDLLLRSLNSAVIPGPLLKAAIAALPPHDADLVVEACSRAAMESSELAAAYSQALDASHLSVVGSANIAIGLLLIRDGPVEEWLRRIPESERNGVYTQIASQLTNITLGAPPVSDRADRVRRFTNLDLAGLVLPKDLAKSLIFSAASSSHDIQAAEILNIVNLAAVSDRTELFREGLRAYCFRTVRRDPTEAQRLVSEADDASRIDVIQYVAETLVGSDPAFVERWLSDTKDPGVIHAIRAGQLADRSTDLSFDKRYEALSAALQDPKAFPASILNKATASYVEDVILADPERAKIIISQIKDPRMKTEVFQSGIRKLAACAPGNAFALVETYPASDFKDAGLREIAISTRDDLQGALSKTATITSASLRVETANEIINYWKPVDREFLHRAMAASEIAEKAQLLRTVDQ